MPNVFKFNLLVSVEGNKSKAWSKETKIERDFTAMIPQGIRCLDSVSRIKKSASSPNIPRFVNYSVLITESMYDPNLIFAADQRTFRGQQLDKTLSGITAGFSML